MESWQEREKNTEVDWNLYEEFNRVISSMISNNSTSLLDLGAGAMLLQKHIKESIKYYPVDYVARCEETIVCDFLKHEFPQKEVDTIVISGLLEYIEDIDWFIKQVVYKAKKEIILRYAFLDNFPDVNFRRSQYWISDVSFRESVKMIQNQGFLLTQINNHFSTQPLLKFEKQSAETLTRYALCTGCGCCANACIFDAIEMKPDEAGFLKPVLIEEKCQDCNICLTKCPSLNLREDNSATPISYACMANDDIREKSSSGGIFTLLAEEMFKRGGVVFGAAWEKDFTVKHIGISDKKDLGLLQKSKYLQSNTKFTFREVKQLLDKNVPVLYTGCPCQIAGLKNYLGKDDPLLITVDLLCSHVPSPQVFRRYLDENYGLENLKSFTFRDKTNGWNPTLQRIEKKNGEVILNDWNSDYLQKGFHPCLFMNDTCDRCFWCTLPRVGDLTLGDFWGIDHYDESLYDGRGTSAVLVNNLQGQLYFDAIKQHFIKTRETPLNIYPSGQLSGMKGKHPGQAQFLDLLKTKSFNDAVEYGINQKFDIGLISMWTIGNYGACMTYFALYQVLKDMGYTILMIERPWDSKYPPSDRLSLFKKSPYPDYVLEKPLPSKCDMRELSSRCETFMVGSDQLFNNDLYNMLGKIVTLDWVPSNKRKIAYAASWGREKINGSDNDRDEMAHFIRQFDAFSVREKSAVDLVRQEFGVMAEQVLDPVFLCDNKYFEELANTAIECVSEGKYIYSYILDPSKEKEKFLLECSKKLELGLKASSDGVWSERKIKSLWDMDTEAGISEEAWLANIKNCEYMITDSFHGVCFAILFKKNFIAICNKKRGATRFESILGLLGLEKRLVYDIRETDINNFDIIGKSIDYDAVYRVLESEKIKSYNWLKKALEKPIGHKTLTDYDILKAQIDAMEKKMRGLEQFSQGLEQRTTAIEKFSQGLEQRTTAIEKFSQGLEQRTTVIEKFSQGLEQRTTATEKFSQGLEQRTMAIEKSSHELEQRSSAIENCVKDIEPCLRWIRKIICYIKRK